MQRTKYISYVFMLLLAVSFFAVMLFQQCANIVPPTGGPRDTIPPEIVESDPENFSTNVTSPVIELTFDKFVQLQNIHQQLIISPPQKEEPEFSIRGKTVTIEFQTDLLPNTTYMMNFGEGIVDLNEGNVLEENEFVFSTGDEIDSLYYEGVVLNAFDSKPADDVVVMLYDNLNDSIPYKEMPLYAARTDEEGRFRVNNLRADTFKVFALKDERGNYLYDSKGEEAIAFRDELLKPVYKSPADADTAAVEEDNSRVPSYPQDDTLYLFREETGSQSVDRTERDIRGKLLFRFSKPLEKEWSIEPLNFSPPDDWKIKEVTQNKDSVIYWITDSGVRETDSLQFKAEYWATGPSDSLQRLTDTVDMNFRARRAEEEPGELGIDPGVRDGGILELNRDLSLTFDTPIADYEEDKIRLYRDNDTLLPVEHEIQQDSVFLRKYLFVAGWEPDKEYKLEAEPGAFTDIFGRSNDSLAVNFETREQDYYGSIILNMEGVKDQLIIQLVDEQENIVGEKIVKEEGELVFEYLSPQSYRIKAIIDRNRNEEWDTGIYLEGVQPEIGVYYPEPVNVRSNWDIEMEWQINY